MSKTLTDPSTDRSDGRGTIRATGSLGSWRTIDLLTVTFLGAALGIAYWGYGLLYNGPISAIGFGLKPLTGLFVGFWFIAGVVGGLVVRRPGAALACETVAALVSMVPGTEWGATVLVSGLIQGLGAELAFALVAYRAFGPIVAALSGALSGVGAWLYEINVYWTDWDLAWKMLYLPTVALSGAVMAGIGGWFLVRALARAGALDAFPPGQEARERHAL